MLSRTGGVKAGAALASSVAADAPLRGVPAGERSAAGDLAPAPWAEFFSAGSSALQSAESSERYRVGILSLSHADSWGNKTAMRNSPIKSTIFAFDSAPSSLTAVLDCVRNAQWHFGSRISGVSVNPIVSAVGQRHLQREPGGTQSC
jgi:hypothetical protein